MVKCSQRMMNITSRILGISDHLLLIFIVGLALFLNLAVMIFVPPNLNLGPTGRWWELILNLASGRGYLGCTPSYFPFCSPVNEATASLEPLPAYIFALVAFLTGRSFMATTSVEIIFFLIILCFVFFLARTLAGNRLALLAALGWAICLPGLQLVHLISGDLLAALFLLISVYYFSRARISQGLVDWVFTGIGLGAGIMSRTPFLVVVPGLVVGLLIEAWLLGRWHGLTQALRFSALIVGIPVAMMIPWVVRNNSVFHEPIVGSTLTGYVLYRQNYMLGSANYLRVVGIEEADQAVQVLIFRHPELGVGLNEAQTNTFFMSEALKVIRAYPGRYLLLSIYRILPLWFNWHVHQAYNARDGMIDYLIMIEQAVFLLFAIYGGYKTWRETWPIWIPILMVSLAYVGVNAQVRYIAQVMPLTVVLSAIGLRRAWLSAYTTRLDHVFKL